MSQQFSNNFFKVSPPLQQGRTERVIQGEGRGHRITENANSNVSN